MHRKIRSIKRELASQAAKEIRKQRLTQSQVADMANVNQSLISRLSTKQYASIAMETLIFICVKLKLRVNLEVGK